MLSGTRIDGKFFIRCAILSFRTHVEHVDEAIDAIVRAAEDGRIMADQAGEIAGTRRDVGIWGARIPGAERHDRRGDLRAAGQA